MNNNFLTIFFALLFPVLGTSQVTQTETFFHRGLVREYIYYAPEDLPELAPLVIVLHGFTSSAENIMNYSGMNRIAKKHGFAVVYPQGTKDAEDKTFWNVGYDFHAENTIDDIDYILQLLAYLQEKYLLSRSNTFVTGMSNGGDMCYLLACTHPGVFAATAPVAGTMMQNYFAQCTSGLRIPIFAISGDTDATTNFNGDMPNNDGWGAYQSIPYIVKFWAEAMEYTELHTDTLPDLNKTDNCFVISQQYLNQEKKLEFLFYRVVNGGHDWPGAWGNQDIDASTEIWHFFEKHMR